MSQVCIIGSGMAGCGAAHFLHEKGVQATVFEKDNHPGGHTASHFFEGGFVFDEGPHISFTKDERIKELFAKSVGGKYRTSGATVNNYWKGHWIKHPAQCNLYGLPTELVATIIKEFFALEQVDKSEINNYEDWLYSSFGKTFSETFPMEYTKKYHTTEAKNLSTDWLGPRLYTPNIDEVLSGALAEATSNVHYITEFRYPEKGGFQSFLSMFVAEANIQLNHEVTEIDTRNKSLTFSNGSETSYDTLISSMPLPEIIKIIKDIPADVLDASIKLACSEVVVVNLGVKGVLEFGDHWTYFYDEDIIFSRLSTPFMQSPNNVPKNCSSLQAECYYSSKYKPFNITHEECIEKTINDLIKCQILSEDDEVIFKNVIHVPYGNVIFDLERNEALKIVHGYLDEVGIEYCGRYGDWEYIWTDESFVSGERAAERAILKSKT